MGSSPIQVAIFASVAQLVEQRTENPRVVGSIPTGGTIPLQSNLQGKQNASVAHLVERHLAKVEVASSSLVTRSNFLLELLCSMWCHSQVVRQRSAKPLRPGSNPGGASKNPVHVSGRDFTYYFLPLHSYLEQNFERDFWEVISKK